MNSYSPVWHCNLIHTYVIVHVRIINDASLATKFEYEQVQIL